MKNGSPIAGVISIEMFESMLKDEHEKGLLFGIKGVFLIFGDVFYGRDLITIEEVNGWGNEILEGRNDVTAEVIIKHCTKRMIEKYGMPKEMIDEKEEIVVTSNTVH